MSSFTDGSRKLIPAVLIYAFNGDRILMMHRDREDDFHFGKWNGLGGKMESDESPIDTMVREWKEESGVSLGEDRFQVHGVIHFPNFIEKKNQDWIVYLGSTDLTDAEANQIPARNREGMLEWIPKDRLLDLNLWEGDRLFLPKLLGRKAFVGSTWYVDGRVKRHWLKEL